MVSLLALSTLATAAMASGFYQHPSSHVIELDSNNFNQVVLDTNQTSLVEFYAPWCGHCQNLKSDYETVGRILDDIVNVGAVNCDLGKNKKLCSQYRIQGYPSILAFRPPKIDIDKPDPINYAHATETYGGQRKAQALIEFATGRIKNYVKRIATAEKLDEWLQNDKSDRPKVVAFTRKSKLSSLLKSIAIDYLGSVDFAYFPLKENKQSIFDRFDIDPKDTKAVVYYFDKEDGTQERYNGVVSKREITGFLGKFDKVKEAADSVLERFELLKKVKNGEKLKKDKGDKKSHKVKKGNNKSEHDEL